MMKSAAKCTLVFILGLTLLVAATALFAQEPRLNFPNGSVTLHATPCSSAKVKAMLKPEYRPQFRDATVIWKGEKLTACWAFNPQAPGEVFILDETGDSGGIPLASFKPTGVGI